MTAQVNLVRPGGQAQAAHRDYHLGFQTADMAARFPAHVHALSSVMTLQGAVAHCDMPVESGPTQLLPFSQLFPEGYMAYRRAEFRAFFEAHAVQLPLANAVSCGGREPVSGYPADGEPLAGLFRPWASRSRPSTATRCAGRFIRSCGRMQTACRANALPPPSPLPRTAIPFPPIWTPTRR
jgi:hypothetical protein